MNLLLNLWARLRSLGMLTQLERAIRDLEIAKRQHYQALLDDEAHQAYKRMLEGRIKRLQGVISSLNEEAS